MSFFKITFKELVENFVGDLDGVSWLPIAEQGAREVIDILPPIYLMRYAPNPVDLYTGGKADWYWSPQDVTYSHSNEVGGPQSKRILKVLRHDGTQWRECNELDFLLFSQASNTNSLYFATNTSPVWTLDTDAGYTKLRVLPAITGSVDAVNSGKVIFVPYPEMITVEDQAAEPSNGIYVDTQFQSAHFIFEDLGFSKDTVNVMALKAGIYITQKLISDAVQDDEDNELLAMLNVQQTSLNAQYEMDMKRLMGAAG